MNATQQAKCFHPKCEVLLQKNDYVCKLHWVQLPSDLRNRLKQSYGTNQKAFRAAIDDLKKHWKMP